MLSFGHGRLNIWLINGMLEYLKFQKSQLKINKKRNKETPSFWILWDIFWILLDVPFSCVLFCFQNIEYLNRLNIKKSEFTFSNNSRRVFLFVSPKIDKNNAVPLFFNSCQKKLTLNIWITRELINI